MRKAYKDSELLTVEKKPKKGKKTEEIIGVNLGWDFCSEHEWGIDKIIRHLGIPTSEEPENFGLKGRTSTVFNEKDFYFNIGKQWAILVLHGHSWMKGSYKEEDVLRWM